MTREQFEHFVRAEIIDLMPGTALVKTEPSPNSQNLLSQIGAPSLLGIKPSKSSDFRIQITRAQAFSRKEKEILRNILSELELISEISIAAYQQDIYKKVVTRGIATFLRISAKESIIKIIDKFDELAGRSYEGQRISLAVGFQSTDKSNLSSPMIFDTLENDFNLVLSNGLSTIIACADSGQILRYQSLDDVTACANSPIAFSAISNWATTDKLALMLNRNGEILIFTNKELLFTKRRGKWQYFAHDAIKRQIAARTQKAWTPALRGAIYESALDCSFARKGGLIGLLKRPQLTAAIETLNKDDLPPNGSSLKSQFLAGLALQNFQDLPRRIRQELLGIDGAMVIRYDGQIVNAGAMIIKIDPTADGGARAAAARTLSNYGVALKISMDGKITAYAINDKKPEKFLTFA